MNSLSNVEIVRLALDQLGASVTISNLLDPQNTQERKAARVYEHTVKVELAKRRWTFAKRNADLTPDASSDPNEHQIPGRTRYAIPADFLRFWRDDDDDFERAGNSLYSEHADVLSITYTARKAESAWDPLFVNLLVIAIALNLREWATKSAGLADRLNSSYEMARRDAAKANAFEIGPENVNAAPTTWQTDRWW